MTRTDAIRQAATNRWREILSTLCGLTEDQLDPKQHQPCPVCSGSDRYRAFDDVAETGGLLCNQCGKFADGFAAIQWLTGCNFREALSKVAEFCGVRDTKKKQPDSDLEWMEWSSGLAAFFCAAKRPITEAALIACGARMARYKRQFTVIALPVVGQELDAAKPVGWVIYNHNGGELPVWNKKGEVTRKTKCKITYGSKPGLVGLHGIERIKTSGLVELAWKVEGVTDLLAMQSLIPPEMADRHVVVTNANGASEIPRWPAGILGRQNCCVLHDADAPGRDGACLWSTQIAAQCVEGAAVKVVELPYEIAETHGKDLRDWVSEGHTYDELLAMVDQSATVESQKTATGSIDYTQTKYPVQERILQLLQVDVLYEDEDGKIRVFSTLLRKSSWIRNVERLRKEHLIQICGPPAMEIISSEPDYETTFSIEDVRIALAMAAATRRGRDDERGIGIWQGLDDWQNETDTVVVVGNTEACRWNGDKVLRRILAPRCDGLTLDFGAGSSEWYEFDALRDNIQFAEDVAWRVKVIERAIELFSCWRWRNPDIDPDLVTGLVLASFVQTIWDWRPMVAVTGESNSGKSYLFEALGGSSSHQGIFGHLAFKQAKSSEAGIRQGLGKTARIPLCDEFEASRERARILEMFRLSTRGESVAKGTASQRGQMFQLRHIPWLAAIESGAQKQPDKNRLISLELLRADPGEHGKLRLPDGRELADLGQRMLAIAVRCAIDAKMLARSLKSTQVRGIDGRTIECYAVPAAMLAVAGGLSASGAANLLLRALQGVDKADQGTTDQGDLLTDILTSSVFLDVRAGTKTVAQVLESPSLRGEYAPRLDVAGVRLLDDGSLFLVPRLIQRELFKGGDSWGLQRLDQILMRLDGSQRTARRIGGQVLRGVEVPSKHCQIHSVDEFGATPQ